MRTWSKSILALQLFAILFGASCTRTPRANVSRTASPPACVRAAPAQCMGAVPDYAHDVEPILRARCFACHTRDGEAAEDHDFSLASRVFAQRKAIQRQVAACAMPLSRAPALSEAQAHVILQWTACSSADPSQRRRRLGTRNLRAHVRYLTVCEEGLR
jgi:hypothetical protein